MSLPIEEHQPLRSPYIDGKKLILRNEYCDFNGANSLKNKKHNKKYSTSTDT